MNFSRTASVLALVASGAISAQNAAVAQSAAVTTSLSNYMSNMCVDVSGAQTQPGAAIIQWNCQGGRNQQWDVVPVNTQFLLRSKATGGCIGVAGASTAEDAVIEQQTCNTAAPNQLWTATKTSLGWTLKVAHSGMCLENPYGSTQAGARLIQKPCHTGRRQAWYGSLPAAPAFNNLGQWSRVLPIPIVASSAALMRDGKVALWSGSGVDTFGGGGKTYSAIFDPYTRTSTATVITAGSHEYFCQGLNFMADGTLVMTGGPNAQRTSVMNTSGQWAAGPLLNVPRGYSSATLTSESKIFTLGGSWSGGVGGKIGELFTPGGSWTVLSNVVPNDFLTADPTGTYLGDNHMWLHGASNGWVFHAGPAKKMHWVSTAGAGTIVNAGLRGDDGDAMNGNTVAYDVNKLLTVGGSPSYRLPIPTNNAFLLDISRGPSVAPSVMKVGSMTHPRAYANSVVLPTGDVIVFGGVGRGGDAFSDVNSVLVPEIWSPTTAKFTSLAPMAVPRNYHSFALLLQDGRVLVGGGGQCGSSCNANHPDVQIFTPPYLLRADGTFGSRPLLTSAPATAAPGQNITVSIEGGPTIFALVRFSSVSHSLNTDQRRIPLTVVSQSATSATLSIPADRGVVLPGDYMLFAMRTDGRPSVAKVINIR